MGYYLKEITLPLNPIVPDENYTVSLNFDDDDKLQVQNMYRNEQVEKTAKLSKDLFWDFSPVKRDRKTKKRQIVTSNISTKL